MKSKKLASFIQKTIYILIIVLCVARFVMNNELSVLGRMVTEAELNEGHYVRENAFLQQQIAMAASLTTISRKASDMGFITASDISYISDAFDVAFGVR